MNPTIDLIMARRSVRSFESRPIPPEVKSQLLAAVQRAPTAGNMMLYSIIDVTDEALKTSLSHSCDEQPFIAHAPLVLVFLADFQRWMDFFAYSGALDEASPKPREADLLLAFSDALIAAQTAVIAGEAVGLGSCYIGDIMERYEFHRDLFDLPPYVFPATMLVFGYPTAQQRGRPLTDRLDRRHVIFENRYRRLEGDTMTEAFKGKDDGHYLPTASNLGQHIYLKKFSAGYSAEMRRSVALALEAWRS